MNPCRKSHPDAAQLKRIRTYWADPDWTMADLVRTYKMSQLRIEQLCADLPPRRKAEPLKRQAPAGLNGRMS